MKRISFPEITTEEKDLLDLFRSLDREGRASTLGFALYLSQAPERTAKEPAEIIPFRKCDK